jgi:hypothetical protein
MSFTASPLSFSCGICAGDLVRISPPPRHVLDSERAVFQYDFFTEIGGKTLCGSDSCIESGVDVGEPGRTFVVEIGQGRFREFRSAVVVVRLNARVTYRADAAGVGLVCEA